MSLDIPAICQSVGVGSVTSTANDDKTTMLYDFHLLAEMLVEQKAASSQVSKLLDDISMDSFAIYKNIHDQNPKYSANYKIKATIISLFVLLPELQKDFDFTPNLLWTEVLRVKTLKQALHQYSAILSPKQIKAMNDLILCVTTLRNLKGTTKKVWELIKKLSSETALRYHSIKGKNGNRANTYNIQATIKKAWPKAKAKPNTQALINNPKAAMALLAKNLKKTCQTTPTPPIQPGPNCTEVNERTWPTANDLDEEILQTKHGQWDQAVCKAIRGQVLFPHKKETFVFLQAASYFKEGSYQQTIDTIAKLKTTNLVPMRQAYANIILGTSYLKLGQYNQALKTYQACELPHMTVNREFGKALAYLGLGQPDKAHALLAVYINEMKETPHFRNTSAQAKAALSLINPSTVSSGRLVKVAQALKTAPFLTVTIELYGNREKKRTAARQLLDILTKFGAHQDQVSLLVYSSPNPKPSSIVIGKLRPEYIPTTF